MSWSVLSMTVIFPLLLVALLAIDLVGPARNSVQSPDSRTTRLPRRLTQRGNQRTVR